MDEHRKLKLKIIKTGNLEFWSDQIMPGEIYRNLAG